jgi:hypothetical protein
MDDVTPDVPEVEPQAEAAAQAPKKAKKPVPAKESPRTAAARARVLAQLAARQP